MTILQHPKEQFHPLNTARIAELGLENSRVIRASFSGLEQAFERALPSIDAAIVYPSADAVDLEDLPLLERPSEIVILDGTWHHAKTLLRELPALRNLRRVRFTPPAPSEYQIRKEPRTDYLSTIESVAHLLRVLEPETQNIEELIVCFRRMIDLNVHARGKSGQSGRFRKRDSSCHHRFPVGLDASPSDVLVFYCEGTNCLGGSQEGNTGKKEALVFVAKRLDGSERMEFVLKGNSTPPDRLLQHLALSKEDIERRGVSLETLRKEVGRRIHPRDLLVAWNSSSMTIAREIGITHSRHLHLKGAYCNFVNFTKRGSKNDPPQGQYGDLESILVRHNLGWTEPSTPGRAHRRLEQSALLFKWLREQQRSFEG